MDDFMELTPYYHYIIIDDNQGIIDTLSTPVPLETSSNTILIDSDGSYQFHFPGSTEENPSLFNESEIPLYKWINGKVIANPEIMKEE